MAGSKAMLLFFLGFLSLSSFATAATESDFFIVSLMWPGSHCDVAFSSCCVPTTGRPAKNFLIQATETYSSITGEPVTNCNSTCKFYVNALQKFIGKMYKHWSDISCPSNNGKDSWETTWCTYGTCTSLNQTTYFNNTLTLRADLHLLRVLKTQGIVPSATEQYDLEKVKSALIANFGFSTVVECNKSWILGESQIYRIRICVATDAKTIISCPISLKSNCDDKVKFPPFPDFLSAHHYDVDDANPIKLPSAQDMAI